MARGERPKTERTGEERERARAERERRRAEREGREVPPLPEPLEVEPPIAPPEPADPPTLPPEPTSAAPVVEDDSVRAPLDPPEAVLDTPFVVEEEAPGAAESAPGAEEPAAEPVAGAEPEAESMPAAGAPEPDAELHEPVPEAPEPITEAPEPITEAREPVAEVPEPVLGDPPGELHEPAAELDEAAPVPPGEYELEPPIAPPEPADPPSLPPEPTTAPPVVEDDSVHAPIDPPEAVLETPIVVSEDESVAAGDDAEGEADTPSRPRRRSDPDGRYPIPGLPEEPEPTPREPLPEPPPRLRESEPTPMRRAFRRSDAGAAGAAGAEAAALASEGRSARPRRARPRWLALAALLAIGVIVALLVYSLSRSSSHKTPAALPTIKVLIPEGKTRLQIAQIASQSGLMGSYRRAARSSTLLNPAQYGAPRSTPDLEGFLFPATYDIDKGAPASRLVEEQLTAFQENFAPEYAARAKALGLTPYQLLIVASMIEREAQVPSDRAKVAAVIYNRLKAGTPIGIDATIYYAVENGQNIPTYTKELTSSQLAIDSPYNTRIRKGLPPTPISNPGVASIQAAAHPAHASYLYYVAGADGCGEQVFSTTEAKFNEDVARYEAAKRANGGHLPACKHH
ncbi:MAG TPA: endolytic transglycosylase MltG [Solirubrobacteraceae bacterium]|nr:endolytic transglycosylase MltG [Solirubrobacteraceae bacterium]